MNINTSPLQHRRAYSASVYEVVRSNDFQRRSKLNTAEKYWVFITLRVSDRQALAKLLLTSSQYSIYLTCQNEITTAVEKRLRTLPDDEHPCYVVSYRNGVKTSEDVLPLFSQYYPPLCAQDYAEEQSRARRYDKQAENQKSEEKNKDKEKTVSENKENVFTLCEADTGEVYKFYLCRFDRDTSPALPKDIKPVSSSSPIGEALLRWTQGQQTIKVGCTTTKAGEKYHVVSRERINFSDAERMLSGSKQKSQIKEVYDLDTDNAKFANGHLAREEKGWGSMPMADKYSDESTGEERDYEEYSEYVANYAD